ncbi:MAG TPA: tetratricopeptide repeat protein [Methanomassiliicoccales archaeon]|nr:tetratricopeptide repeat protein [Methanomassiliicoccales archaeon]
MHERIEVGSRGNPNFIEVRHGKLLIAVPCSIFKGRTSTLRPREADEFKKLLSARYPWLSANAIEVVMEEAQETMESLLSMERGAVERAEMLASEGRHAEALATLEQHLVQRPKDPDAWYLMGEIYFKLGRKDDGYRAFALAKGHSSNSGESRRKER